MGVLYYRQGNLAEAEQWLNKALGSDALYRPATFYYLAMVRHERGNDVGAQEAFRKAERYRELRELRNAHISASGPERLRYGSLFIEAVRREAEKLLSSD
jgi:tetratricopeptide (TPR) repeat protein